MLLVWSGLRSIMMATRMEFGVSTGSFRTRVKSAFQSQVVSPTVSIYCVLRLSVRIVVWMCSLFNSLEPRVAALHAAESYPGAQFYVCWCDNVWSDIDKFTRWSALNSRSPVVEAHRLLLSTSRVHTTVSWKATRGSRHWLAISPGSDPGITVNIYANLSGYIIPGPPVLNCDASGGSSSTVTSRTTGPTTTTAPTGAGSVAQYGQCGGIG